MPFQYCHLATPVGELLLVGDSRGLCHIGFPDGDRRQTIEADWIHDDTAHAEARRQLSGYFAGSRTSFELKLNPVGTPFQQHVWRALQQIGYGDCASYGDVARLIGRPKASRAVGAANGANPLPIVIPCHRVIGASGKLTGFGGGLATKQWLLAHERGERSLFEELIPRTVV